MADHAPAQGMALDFFTIFHAAHRAANPAVSLPVSSTRARQFQARAASENRLGKLVRGGSGMHKRITDLGWPRRCGSLVRIVWRHATHWWQVADVAIDHAEERYGGGLASVSFRT
jgi:hypothetical protein